jgi:hypothetical protein
MKIRMLSTAPGSVDGIRVSSYEEGQEYDLTTTAGARELAEAFVGSGLAEEAGAKTVPASAEPEATDPVEASTVDAADAPAPAKPGRKPKAQ